MSIKDVGAILTAFEKEDALLADMGFLQKSGSILGKIKRQIESVLFSYLDHKAP